MVGAMARQAIRVWTPNNLPRVSFWSARGQVLVRVRFFVGDIVGVTRVLRLCYEARSMVSSTMRVTTSHSCLGSEW